ncbi:MAG: hypothetical protein ACSLEN_04245 [Candidatus Malihini olakiniferum]
MPTSLISWHHIWTSIIAGLTNDQKNASLIPLMLKVNEAKGNTRYRNRIEKAGFSTFLSGMTRDKQDVGGEIGEET